MERSEETACRRVIYFFNYDLEYNKFMKIKNSWLEQSSGLQATAEYEDIDDFSSLPYDKCKQVFCFAFFENKLLLVYDWKKKVGVQLVEE